MTRKMVPPAEVFAEWRRDPTYVREHAGLEEEFAVAAALIDARGKAHSPRKTLPPGCRLPNRRLRALKEARPIRR
jgi:hypothetical protein